MVCWLAALALTIAPSTLIQGGTVYDGSGAPGRVADVRIRGAKIEAVGHLRARDNEMVIRAKGLAVAPGFIDAHSHANGRGEDGKTAPETQIPQGITTAVCGQDGGWQRPVSEEFAAMRRSPFPYNIAYFSGEGGIRKQVLGDQQERAATPDQIRKMQALVEADMQAGALGLSTGLEYEPGKFSTTAELVALAKVAARYKGMYISHVRDESNGVMKSFRELITICRQARMPGQISHIKMAVQAVHGKANEAFRLIADARKSGLNITADVYPYLYWQSTIRVLPTRAYEGAGSIEVWRDALKDVGGPDRVLLSGYSVNKAWEGKTLAQLATTTGKDPAQVAMEISQSIDKAGERATVIVAAMEESDLQAFIRSPLIMFCSDGSNGASHPRGAGSFPRVLARYVRDLKTISLQEAIRKMTSLPARTFGLRDRGLLRKGMYADIVVFDPKRIQDTSTPANPTQPAVGVVHVIVNGRFSMRDGKLTGAKPGMPVRKSKS
jgi:N-acyl-D-amino-acid deacylase